MKIHLVSFADGTFRKRRAVFQNMAEAFGLFDTVSVHSHETLPKDFLVQHHHFMQTNTRGFGYWIWKPAVILEALENSDPNDVIVYLDAGFSLNIAGLPRFGEYLELTQDSAFKMLSFQNIFTEAHWTKADVIQRLGLSLSHSHTKTSQLGGGFILLQKTQSNLDLLRQWAEISVEDHYRYSDNSPSQAKNHPLFQEHRHDQSIASLLRKMRGTEVTHYEVQAFQGMFDRFKNTVPTWAERLKK